MHTSENANGQKLTARSLRAIRGALSLAFTSPHVLPTGSVNPFGKGSLAIRSHEGDETIHREPILDDKMIALVKACEASDDREAADMIIAGATTALRRGDVALLKWENVNLDENLPGVTWKGAIHLRTSKTGTPVDLPIVPRLHHPSKGKVQCWQSTYRRRCAIPALRSRDEETQAEVAYGDETHMNETSDESENLLDVLQGGPTGNPYAVKTEKNKRGWVARPIFFISTTRPPARLDLPQKEIPREIVATVESFKDEPLFENNVKIVPSTDNAKDVLRSFGEKVREIMLKSDGILRKELTRKSQYLNRSVRNECLDDLIEAGQVRVLRTGSGAELFKFSRTDLPPRENRHPHIPILEFLEQPLLYYCVPKSILESLNPSIEATQ